MTPNQPMPPGMKKFLESLPDKTREAGTGGANLDCEKCGTEMLLVGPGQIAMHVMVYPDAPYHTTKALCWDCFREEYKKTGGTNLQVPQNARNN